MHAQGAVTVPASSTIYERIEAITAVFPASGVQVGLRPLSRREIDRVVEKLAHIVDSASAKAAAPRHDWAREELDAIRAALRIDDKAGTPVTVGGSFLAEFVASNARTERIDSNGLGLIDAFTNPYFAERHGRPLVQGSVTTVAPTAFMAFGSRGAIVLQPRLSLVDPGGNDGGELRLHRAYARGLIGNVAVQIGLDESMWGQSPFGALFISGNAAPLPALVVGSDAPFTLPWLFRLAGPVRATGLLADLGGDQDPPHARLAGWQVTIQPWYRFELGVAVLAQTGGSGGPKATFFERLVDLFPVIDALAPQHADLQFSNKLAGGNLRLRFPELSALDVYYELQIDDFDGRRLRSSLTEDAAHLLGARLPLQIAGGELAWRAEWHVTSLRLYEHTQFRSGVTYRDRLIGSPLGPHARAGYVSAAWQRSPFGRLEFSMANERRDPSLYTVTASDTLDRGFRFIRLTDDPNVRRRRIVARLDRAIAIGEVQLRIGHNRAWRSAGPARGEWLGMLSLASRHFSVF